MKITDNFLQNCMYWLTEISLYNRRIQQMQRQLAETRIRLAYKDGNEPLTLGNQLKETLTTIKELEASIIFLIRDNAKDPANTHVEGVKLKIESEEEIFERMINGYTQYVELQREFNQFLKNAEVQKPSSKVIDLQRIRKMTSDIERISETTIQVKTASN